MEEGRLHHLDALRGWAILSVIVFHVGAHFPGAIASATTDGAYGVELFYTVSAFTLFHAARTRHASERYFLRNFFIRRFFRIAPLFYLVVLFYVIKSWVWNFGDPPTHNVPLREVVELLFFVNGFSPYYLNRLFGEWSIATEMMFYTLMPLLLRKIRRFEQVVYLTLGALLGGYLLTSLPSPISDTRIWDTYRFFWFPNHAAAFCFGIVAFFVVQKPLDPRHAGWLTTLALYLALAIWRGSAGNLYGVAHHLQYGFAFVPLIVGLHLRKYRLLVNRVTIHLGQISYGCYLLHNPVKERVQPFIFATHFSPVVKFAALLSLVLALTGLFATVTYRFIEQPGIALGKRLIARLDARLGARPAVPVRNGDLGSTKRST
jgi:peptidoglycan/LPS O-acetylase OafA/YrhL